MGGRAPELLGRLSLKANAGPDVKSLTVQRDLARPQNGHFGRFESAESHGQIEFHPKGNEAETSGLESISGGIGNSV